jgi:hypothetical protein
MEDFEIVLPSNAFDVIAEAVKDMAEEATTGADFFAIGAGLNELEEMAGKLSERDGSDKLVGGDVLRIERCRKLLQQVIAELVE